MACFTTLYSGSSGNCAFLEEDGRFLLVDLGKSARATTRALGQLGAQAKQLCGVLVTHEHTDHIAGLAVFLKKAPVPVYGTQATLEALARINSVPHRVHTSTYLAFFCSGRPRASQVPVREMWYPQRRFIRSA